METKIRSHGAHFANNCRQRVRPFREITPDDQLNAGARLVLILLLSLGLWAAIWGAVASLFSATL